MLGKRMCQSYEIIDSQRVGDTEVVLGHSPTEVSPYVTWKCYAYDGTNDLCVYAVVILTHQSGVKIRYRTTNMHYFLVGGDNGWFTFEKCMAHLLEDSCGQMTYCTVHDTKAFQQRAEKYLKQKREGVSR